LFISKDSLEHYLCSQNFPAISIHGDRSQGRFLSNYLFIFFRFLLFSFLFFFPSSIFFLAEREHAMRSFKKGTTPFLIATNVASRGLDIQKINSVINYDMPNDIDEYVHRIGRTGRAGKAGVSTSLISQFKDKSIIPELLDLLQETGQGYISLLSLRLKESHLFFIFIEIPSWLESMRGHGGSRNAPRRRGGFDG
jgi:ATP-dependent RNA helicase DDX3X